VAGSLGVERQRARRARVLAFFSLLTVQPDKTVNVPG
jgi:hypothetical protein